MEMILMKALYKGKTGSLSTDRKRIYIVFDHCCEPVVISFDGLVDAGKYSSDGMRRTMSKSTRITMAGQPISRSWDITIDGVNIFDISIQRYQEIIQEIYDPRKVDHPIALLNCSIITSDGEYEMHTISLDEAKLKVSYNQTISAIGHTATAAIMAELLGCEVPVNRINFEQEITQQAIVFKLNVRIPEGKILSREEIEEIGYSFKLLTRIN
jgi:hypothetical protein